MRAVVPERMKCGRGDNHTVLLHKQTATASRSIPVCALVLLKIEDQMVVAISGKAHHTMARFTGRTSDVVSGTVFAVTPDEIQNADKYEVAAVKRVAVVLQSGVCA